MSVFDNLGNDDQPVKPKSKTGPKSKHNFETMKIGETKPFPDGVKTSSLRVMLSIKGAENNMKFSVSGTNKTVTRIS